jgi:hypothetical protein
MTQKEQVIIVDVVVINLTWEIMASNVISRPTRAIAELSAIAKIHKYRMHHFIIMAMEVHIAPG